MEEKKPEIEVRVSDEVIKGTYSNQTLIFHTRSEFIFDFMTVFQPKGILGARIIISPHHAKSLLKAIQENIALYEKKFGTLEEVSEAPSSITMN